jgi:L-lactate dehydrogenase complex protein LldF
VPVIFGSPASDLVELLVQSGDDSPSHILVPAIHRDRAEVREIFLREKFLRAEVAVSGANFAVAETGTLAVVESEGNGRMCHAARGPGLPSRTGSSSGP